MKRYISILILIVFLIGCSNQSITKRNNDTLHKTTTTNHRVQEDILPKELSLVSDCHKIIFDVVGNDFNIIYMDSIK